MTEPAKDIESAVQVEAAPSGSDPIEPVENIASVVALEAKASHLPPTERIEDVAPLVALDSATQGSKSVESIEELAPPVQFEATSSRLDPAEQVEEVAPAAEVEGMASRSEPRLLGEPAWLEDDAPLPLAHRMEDPEALPTRASPPLALNIGNGNDPPWVNDAQALPAAPPTGRAKAGWRALTAVAVGALLVVIAAAGASYVIQYRARLSGTGSALAPPASEPVATHTSDASASDIKLASGVDASTARSARAAQDALAKGLPAPAPDAKDVGEAAPKPEPVPPAQSIPASTEKRAQGKSATKRNASPSSSKSPTRPTHRPRLRSVRAIVR